MPVSFDPYYQWLGIRDPERPPNHYRLLGIELFESSLEVIATAADRQMAHLRTYRHGKNVELSERLLNEVSAAKVCLLDAKKKAAYDAVLRKGQTPDAPPMTPPEVEIASDGDQPDIILSDEERGALSRPGRSSRRRLRSRQLSTLVLAVSLLVLVIVVAVRLLLPNEKDALVDAPRQVRTEEGSEAEPAPANATSEPDDAGRDPVTADVDLTNADDDASRPAVETPAEPPDTVRTQPPTTVDLAPDGRWLPNETRPEQRPQFSASDPYEAVLLALSNRNLSAAQSLINGLNQRNTSRAQQKRDQLKLLIYNMDRFWRFVEQSKVSVQRGTRLLYRGEPVMVTAIDSRLITLEDASGAAKTFDLRAAEMDPDLAIGLIDHRFQQAPGPGWRLIGSFLMIDKDGNVARGREYLQRAENHGFDADFLARAINAITGQDHEQLVAIPTTSDDAPLTEVDPTLDQRIAVPTPSKQTQTRQELKKQDLLDPSAARCLEYARAEEERPIAQFVLLKEAARRALVNRDVESGLAAVDLLSERFQVERWDLRFDLLQRLSRSAKRDERPALVDLALGLSSQAVAEDNYEQGHRFADLAMSIGRALRDEGLRTRLAQRRERIKQIERDFAASRDANDRLAKNADDPPANAKVGEFLCFAKGDFAQGLPHLKLAEDAGLRKLAAADLANPRKSADRQQVAQGWRTHARKVQGIYQLHALDRARHWYQLSLLTAPAAEASKIRQTLNEIAELMGQHEKILDATVLYPLSSKTGYGKLGINENPVVNYGRIRELPRIQGREISRFLWAHAPSMVEYDVPKGAKTFSAVGILNADSTDGAEFFVQVDGKTWFSSGVLQTRGQRVPIAVRLPESAQKIVLNVDSKDGVQDDQTYWVNPVFTF